MRLACKVCQKPISERDRAIYRDRCEDCWVRDNGTWTASYKTETVGEPGWTEQVQRPGVDDERST